MPSPTTSSATTTFSLSGVNNTDALLDSTHVKWSSHALTYSFPWLNGAISWWKSPYSGDQEPWASPYHYGLNSTQVAAATNALQAWCTVANITMTQVADTQTNVGDFRFGFSSAVPNAGSGIWGWCYYPSSEPNAADIWMNPSVSGDSWAIKSYNYEALMHEIGHGLGLKHPGNYNAGGGGTPGPYIDASLDYRCYTIMSYNDLRSLFWDTTQHKYINVNPETPMVYDIVAIQYLYGANNNYKTGNDTYTFNASVPFYKTIWDAGGNDTIDISNFTTNCTIDLTPGHYSSLRYTNSGGLTGTQYYDGTNNLGIAFGVTIENANGGSGNDTITGNNAINVLNGRGGNDDIWGIGGGDTLNGGEGNDVLQVSSDHNTLNGDNGNDYLIVYSGHNNILNGGAGNDYLAAYSSGNILNGGIGNDTLDSYGSAGANTLIGGAGDDIYLISNFGDIITEKANEGTDYVNVAIPVAHGTYTLPANVENAAIITPMSNIPVEFTLIGNSLNNILTGGPVNSTLFGSAGVDTFNVIAATDTIGDLGNGADILKVSSGATAIAIAAGNFTATSSTSNFGTASINANGHNVNLALAGGTKGWTITNSSSTGATLIGSSHDDSISGGNGNDTLTGGGSSTVDMLYGGAGADTFNLTSGMNQITDFGNGADILKVSSNAGAIVYVTGNFTATSSTTNSGNAYIDANGHNMSFALAGGTNGWNISNQSATGAALIGSSHNDTISGGTGNDTLTGGSGADKFVFNTTPNSLTNHDTITDFVHGSDLLQLSTGIFNIISPWNASEFWSGAGVTAGHDPTDRIVYNTATGNLYYDADGNGPGSAVLIALIGTTTHPAIAYTDIQLVA